MSTITLNLYVTRLLKEKNQVVDNLGEYLYGRTKTSFATFQYLRPLKTIQVKVDLDQEYSQPKASGYSQYNYMSFTMNSKIYFYFITNMIQKSVKTIELTCEMDVLNTFKWNVDYTPTAKTLVRREHKDRLKANTNYGNNYWRIINLQSEGINAPLFKQNEQIVTDGKTSTTWALFYRNRNGYDQDHPDDFNFDNPVDCYLMTKDEAQVAYVSTTNTLTTSDISDGYSLMFVSNYNEIQPKFKIGNDYYHPSHSSSYLYYVDIIKNEGGTLTFIHGYFFYYTPFNRKEWHQQKKVTGLASVEFINPQSSYKARYDDHQITANEFFITSLSVIASNRTLSLTGSTTTTINGVDAIDRTDERNIKIIDIPYSPTQYDVDNSGFINMSSDWELDPLNHWAKLASTNTKFNYSFSPLDMGGETLKVLSDIGFYAAASSFGLEKLRNDFFESKIFHSDFYQPRFVYDSFSFTFQLELIDIDFYNTSNYQVGSFNVEFYMTRNMQSKFLFKFPDYVTKYSTGDYDNILLVARNNEEFLLNSQYINYIRNGYNYDVKSKQRNEIAGGVGIGLSALSTAAGVIGGIATQNYAVAIGAAVAGGISIANQSISYAKAIAEADSNIERKLKESAMAAVSVRNGDDVDLLYAYSGNLAKVCYYQVSPTMKQALLDMFYYTGYATQEHKVPSINSRCWFNFVQCDLVCDDWGNIPQDIIDAIKKCFSDGVTFMHHQNVSAGWNWNFTYENFETWLIS